MQKKLKIGMIFAIFYLIDFLHWCSTRYEM